MQFLYFLGPNSADVERQRYCIIIDNIHDEVDTALNEVFNNKLGFHTEIYSHLKREGIHQLLAAVAKVDYEQPNCLLVVMLTKGKKGKYIYGEDGKKIRLNDIISHFCSESSTTLANSPKMFITETVVRETQRRDSVHCQVDPENSYIINVTYFNEQPAETFIQHMKTILQSGQPCTLQGCIQTTRNIFEQNENIHVITHGTLKEPFLSMASQQVHLTYR